MATDAPAFLSRLRHRLPYIVSLRGSDVPGYNPRLRLLDPLLFRGVSRRVWRGAARGQVIFHGRLDHSALARIYQESSIFILPAVSDAMPNVVLEAMAAGLAIVTTRTGAGELIRDNGVVIDRPEAPAIQEAIVRYLGAPELLAAHRKNSRC